MPAHARRVARLRGARARRGGLRRAARPRAAGRDDRARLVRRRDSRTGFHLALLEDLRERAADLPLQEALRSLLVRSRAALPHGPESTITDRVLAWRSSPAWAEYLAGDAETWLHALLAHTTEAELRDALLADPEVPSLLARTRLRRAAR